MESFKVTDLDWEGKMEPTSPGSLDSSYSEELILEDYDFCNEGLFNNALFDIVLETKPVLTSDLMSDIPVLMPVLKQEKTKKDQWLGEKLKLPLLTGSYVSHEVVASEIGPFSHQLQPEKVQNTEELLMEFDYVYENVELTHLTPPQTPPQAATHFAGDHHAEQQQQQFVLVQQQQPTPAQQQQQQDPDNVGFYSFSGNALNGLLVNSVIAQHSPETLQQVPGQYQLADSFGFQPVDEVENIARNLELVEEIVRSRSKDLPDCNDDEDSCSFSETASVSSACPSSDSNSSYCGSAYSRDQDDEWSPASGRKASASKVVGGGVVKKRTRPYGRGIEDKKSRKKEQNKNAATRYRQKKKAEIEEILVVENKLKEKNEELRNKSADIGREIRYLKSLMREICKAKGLI